MNLIQKFRPNFKRLRFSLSTRIILGMAGMVLLTALASIFIFNTIITNQTRDLETRFQKGFSQVREYRKQNQVSPQVVMDRVRVVLSDPSLTPEVAIERVRVALRNDEVDPEIIKNILRESGLPVSGSDNRGRNGPPPPPGMDNAGNNVYKIGGGPGFEAQSELISPVLQSFLLGSLLAVICAVGLGFFLARTLIRPLRTLEQASERIADGNYSLEIQPEGDDDTGRLARSFNKMSRALRLTEQKRKELVADVAHELRTPLSSIQGYTEVLRDGLVPGRDRQEEIHNHILKEVRHVTTMVDSMRAWVSNEQALEHLNLEEVPARVPVQMVVDRFYPLAEQKGVQVGVEVDEQAVVRADSDALNHILSNLVDNALRYTACGGTVNLAVTAPTTLPDSLGQAQRVVWFEVSDTGSGISAEHLPFVFERFYRVDKSRDRATGGTGLGLAIVRDTVQALGGEVQIKSQPGSGTTVSFWLPASREATPPRKPGRVLVGSKAG